jgi:hypothetical protein
MHKTCNFSAPHLLSALEAGLQSRWVVQLVEPTFNERGSTRTSVRCAVSASPECLMNRGELHRLRTGSPAHCSRPRGPGSTFPLARRNRYTRQPNLLFCPECIRFSFTSARF